MVEETTVEQQQIKTTEALVEGRPSDLAALASYVVDELDRYIKNNAGGISMAFGEVISIDDEDPPTTLTVHLNGFDVPNIRFIGQEPAETDIVAVLISGNRYLCIGILAE